MSENTLTITDNRTGKQYQVGIENGTIKAMDLRQIKVSDGDFGLMTYDPAFMNTASCKSRITFIDGEKGILEYRGYPLISWLRRARTWKLLISYCTVNSPTSLNFKRGPAISLITPLLTRTSKRSSTVFTTTLIQWACLKRCSVRCRRSTRMLKTS